MCVQGGEIVTGKMNRRRFILSFITGVLFAGLYPLLNWIPVSVTARLKKYLRPPGAKSEADFLKKCIGCGQCAAICPNKCITLSGLENGVQSLGTPKIIPKKKACILCMACTNICPTGALSPLKANSQSIAQVAMGKAFLSKDTCFSYAGRTCGVCYHACPLPGKALTLGLFERPTVNRDYCVGCGLCEYACIHMPQAIRVVPSKHLQT